MKSLFIKIKKSFRSLFNRLALDVQRPSQVGSRQAPETIRRQKLMENLHKINASIEACYALIRSGRNGGKSEELYLKRIQVLEDLRFQLLERLNGNAIEDYNTLPLKVAGI